MHEKENRVYMSTFVLAIFVIYFRYMRQTLIWLFVIGLSACKDLKNWESAYTDQIKIKFESAKNKTGHLQFLRSKLLEKEMFFLTEYAVKERKKITHIGKLEELYKKSGSEIMDPDASQVSFKVKNAQYYHKVTIVYKVVASLISPEAGGIQRKYTIQQVHFEKKAGKQPIFQEEAHIAQAVLVKKEKDDFDRKDDYNIKLFY